MCKYSVAHAVRDANANETLNVGTVKSTEGVVYGTLKDCKNGACACVKDGTVLTLSNIPERLRQQFGLGASEIVTMVDRDIYDEDLLRINRTGQNIPLKTFAVRPYVTAFVGVNIVAEKAAQTATDVMADALAGAEAARNGLDGNADAATRQRERV